VALEEEERPGPDSLSLHVIPCTTRDSAESSPIRRMSSDVTSQSCTSPPSELWAPSTFIHYKSPSLWYSVVATENRLGHMIKLYHIAYLTLRKEDYASGSNPIRWAFKGSEKKTRSIQETQHEGDAPLLAPEMKGVTWQGLPVPLGTKTHPTMKTNKEMRTSVLQPQKNWIQLKIWRVCK
jgi:hypothetical protein